MKIDLGAKKTESGWNEAVDKFWKDVASAWFDWLGWVLTIGAFAYIADKTSNLYVHLIVVFSNLALYFYLQSVFFSFEFHNIPLIKNEKRRRLVSVGISAILSLGVWFLMKEVISQLKKDPLN